MLPGSSDGEKDFDVLEPKSWPVESCFPIGAKVSSATHGTLLTFRRTRCIIINAFFLGVTQIASVYEMCIQWGLYEAARIWKLKVPLARVILLDIPSLNCVCGELPQISSSI